MACKLSIIGVLWLVYCTRSVYAAIDGTTPCNGGPGVVGANCDATNNELCSGNPGVCECDAASGYEVSSGDSTVCALVDCPRDTPPAGYINLANTVYGQSATADCDANNGYSGTAVLAAGACKTDGTWDVASFSGCSLKGGAGVSVDLGNSCTNDLECTSGKGGSGSKCGTSTDCKCDASRNYVASGSTCVLGGAGGSVDLGDSCTNDGECTSGNGGSGSKCGTTSTNCECDASRNYVASGSNCVLGGAGVSVDLGNSCTNDGECTSGNGGSGSKCGTSTNCECDASRNYVASGSTCVLDCASDATPTGYTNLASTKYGESATADCVAGYAGTATLATGACQANGTWDASKFSGCTLAGAGTTLLSMFNVVSMIAFILMMKLI